MARVCRIMGWMLSAGLLLLLACGKPAEQSDAAVMEAAVDSLLPIGVYQFDSYAGEGKIRFYWSLAQPARPQPHKPLPQMHRVKLFMSEEGPYQGFGEVYEAPAARADSALIDGLRGGQLYYFRLAVYDKAGNLIGLSAPLMTECGRELPVQGSVPLQVGENPVYFTNLAWSPDGKALAVIRKSSGGRHNVFVLDLKQRRWRQVTRFSTANYRLTSVDWSPNGRWLAFTYTPTARAREVDYRIYLCAPDGGGLRSVTDGRVDFDAVWGSPGELVFCKGTVTAPNVPELYRLDFVHGRKPVRLTLDRLIRKYTPAVNPRTGQIVFSGQPPSSPVSRGLYLLRNASGEPGLLTEIKYWRDIQPAWSADGTGLFFVSNRSGHYEIWFLNLEDGRLHQVTRGMRPGIQRFHGKPSPDGRWLVFYEAGGDLTRGYIRLAALPQWPG